MRRALRVQSPSKYSSRSFLRAVIANDGRVDRMDGTCGEYDIEEAKALLYEKEERAADALFAARMQSAPDFTFEPETENQNHGEKTMSDILATKALLDSIATGVLTNAQDIANLMLENARNEIEQIKKRDKPVMRVVTTDGKERKLSKPASPLLPKLLGFAAIKRPVLIKGPTGSGKTTVAEQVAEALGLPFYRHVFSPDQGVSALFGKQTPTGFTESAIVQAAKNGGVLLLDEMDAAAPELLVALNGLTDRKGLANIATGERLDIHPDCIIIAACNTWAQGPDHQYTGRNRLDAASTRRFFLYELGYDQGIERAIAAQFTDSTDLLEKLWAARAKLEKLGSDHGICTRRIEMAHEAAYLLEMPFKEVFQAITADWPSDLVKQVGLN